MARVRWRGHEALRRGRWSASGAEYFLTICTEDKQSGLSRRDVRSALLAECERMESEVIWTVRTIVVMPDHLHLLIILGETLELSAVVRLFKGRMTPRLRAEDLRWERGYFDHRVRTEEDRAPVFRYMFLNPYRAGLIQTAQTWDGYYCSPQDWAWFGPMTNEACPYPEWLE